uniref:Secreted protein n=1 Tax=Rhipicephalus appendiculatus TaxID=34631 RepID=A0A131YI66_RHIAP
MNMNALSIVMVILTAQNIFEITTGKRIWPLTIVRNCVLFPLTSITPHSMAGDIGPIVARGRACEDQDFLQQHFIMHGTVAGDTAT